MPSVNATSPALDALAEKITSRSCRVGVYGLGYVGLPLALRFAEMSIQVTGFDIGPRKVETLNAGASHIERLPPSQIAQARRADFTATLMEELL